MTETTDLNNSVYIVGLIIFYWMLFNLGSQFVPSSDDAAANAVIAPAGSASRIKTRGESLSAVFEAIGRGDRNFSETTFLAAAVNVHEIILSAFAAGDERILEPLLGREVLDAFTSDISNRRQRHQTLDLILIGERDTTIINAAIAEGMAEITVQFLTDVVKATRSGNGAIVDGDSSHIIEICDVWTFSRKLEPLDSAWRLTRTASV